MSDHASQVCVLVSNCQLERAPSGLCIQYVVYNVHIHILSFLSMQRPLRARGSTLAHPWCFYDDLSCDTSHMFVSSEGRTNDAATSLQLMHYPVQVRLRGLVVVRRVLKRRRPRWFLCRRRGACGGARAARPRRRRRALHRDQPGPAGARTVHSTSRL